MLKKEKTFEQDEDVKNFLILLKCLFFFVCPSEATEDTPLLLMHRVSLLERICRTQARRWHWGRGDMTPRFIVTRSIPLTMKGNIGKQRIDQGFRYVH